ncbi:PREDICTED: kinesin-like protein subito [Nicrophorus vespilloides]|uniref:Kinesin-like protein subito n=1 Tax=Nicrophorus vespilloides TaxID=110193 RepID=A0ABM1N140_NICVS|nr:PREDICTED: kinesin-like protein subito [Nicrophorus vespilloides]
MDRTYEDDIEENQMDVFLRVKNEQVCNMYEIEEDVITCRDFDYSDSLDKQFMFTHIFPPETKQEEIFDSVVRQRLWNFIQGQSATVLCYGTSGAGKTYTVMGKVKAPGIIPRSLNFLFKTLPELPMKPSFKLSKTGLKPANLEDGKVLNEIIAKNADAKTFKMMLNEMTCEEESIKVPDDLAPGVWVSFAEIYNENIYDLLDLKEHKSKTRQKLKLINNNGVAYVQNLKNVYVPTAHHAFQVFQYGMTKLQYASTSVNSHSSRSHCIFSITLVHAQRQCVFNFCDLAGTERVRNTQNAGKRLKEANNINTSLMVLGRCLEVLRKVRISKSVKPIPFRESKLTQLLQRALLGYEDLAMIVNVNPVKEYFNENLHVFNFSAIAKDIVVMRKPSIVGGRRSSSSNISEFHDATDDCVYCDHTDMKEEISRLNEMNSRLLEEYKILQDEIEVGERMVRRQLINEFERMIAEIKSEHDKEINEYNCALSELNKKYEALRKQQLTEKRRDESTDRSSSMYSSDTDSVICLNTSSESSSSEF